MKSKVIAFLAGLALSMLSFQTQAGVYKVDFSFTGFTDVLAHNPAVISPVDHIAGSFVYTASSGYSSATSVLAVDLDIMGHKYGLDELSAWAEFPTPFFGGNTALINSITYPGLHDFIFAVRDPASLIRESFRYTAPNSGSIFISKTGSVTVTEVDSVLPEPSIMLLFMAAGFAALTLRGRHNILKKCCGQAFG